jgi:hypothetical protein
MDLKTSFHPNKENNFYIFQHLLDVLFFFVDCLSETFNKDGLKTLQLAVLHTKLKSTSQRFRQEFDFSQQNFEAFRSYMTMTTTNEFDEIIGDLLLIMPNMRMKRFNIAFGFIARPIKNYFKFVVRHRTIFESMPYVRNALDSLQYDLFYEFDMIVQEILNICK